MKAKDILQNKNLGLFTIGESDLVEDALNILLKNHIGVLPVVNAVNKLVGMVSERDILREVHFSRIAALNKNIHDIMTKKIIYAEPEDDIDFIESMMTQNKIRHIPILNNDKLIGIISIGDIVKISLKDKNFENKYLLEYISGNVK
jgi:CBS domain-containing protein